MKNNVWKIYSPNEWLILLLFASAFISVFAIVGVLILVPVYFFVTKQARKALPENVWEWLIVAFALIGIISTFAFSKNALWDSATNTFQLQSWYLKVLSILILILSIDVTFLFHILTKRALTDSLKLSAIMSYPCFAVALLQKILGLYASPDRPGRFASVFRNENYYGVAIECLVLISLYLLIREKERKNKLLYAGAIAFNLAGLWLCQCRTAFLVIIFSLIVFLSIFDRKYLFITLGIALLGGLVIWLKPSLLPRLDSLSDNMSFRLGIWKAALKGFLDNPIIGRGYFSYSGLWETYSSGEFFAIHAHNMYLEVLLNFGITGFLSLVGYSGYQVIESVKACRNSKRRLETALIFSILCALLLHGALDTTFFWPQTGIFFAMILAGSNAYKLEK
ncbi:MAG: O-antigen ligase family protein [Clostridia bacterium]|nr:O-antigen ligase family protein [Clostridia bacterium]